jgi:hypothetical protein
MKKELFVLISIFLFVLPAFAAPPVCLYQDVLSGPASGGEGGNGIYLDIYGLNFGASRDSSTVTVNGTAVAQYLYWGADPTGDRQQIGVQIASGTTGTGNIVVTTPGGSCSNLTFTVRSGKIWFIGPNVDTSAPTSCATMEAPNSYSTPWGLDLTDGMSVADSGGYSTYRTPYTYLNCLSPSDTIVFLAGTTWPYYDGRGWHASLTTPNSNGTCSASSFYTIMARPGAAVQLGSTTNTVEAVTGYSYKGILDLCGYGVVAGLDIVGSTDGGIGTSIPEGNASLYGRLVGNEIQCQSCDGAAAAVEGGDYTNAYADIYGNWITNVSTTANGGAGSAKEFHDVYMSGSNFEFAWNKISNTLAYNGVQVHHDNASGFYNFSIHDNDIADLNGSGVNLSAIDPSSGYVSVYNNIIHHTGITYSSDGGAEDPHSCIAVKGYGSATGVGTAEIYNNTMYDCSSILATRSTENASCAVLIYANQLNVTTNLVNNVVYQPSYGAGTAAQNVYICGGGSVGTFSGSNNIWYSASTPGSTAYASTIGTVTENPLYVNVADCSGSAPCWANYGLQSTSPAIAAGSASLYPTLDFAGNTRPSRPAIGALEYGSASSAVQVTASATPSPATVEQPVTLTATVAQTGSSIPTGSINFMNGGVSLGQASLDNEGTATLVLSWLSVGSYKAIAAYSGDSNYPAGESGYVPLQVLSTTTASLTASPNPVSAGQTLTLTATLTGDGSVWPTGTVTFLNGSTLLGTATLDSSSVATLSTTSLAAGTYSLTAQYAGNANFLSSTSVAVSVTVNAQATTTSLAASPNPVATGQTLTLTAAVEGRGSTTPAGTVSFLSGSTLLGTATLNSSGVATLSTTSLAAGTYSLTAQYSGNANFLSSTSTAVSVTVNAQATTTDLPFSFNTTGSTPSQTVQPGGSATYTLSVSPALGTTLPAITFTAAGLPAGYTAIFSPPNIAAGSGATNVTLTIQVPLQAAVLERDRKLHAGLSLVALCILLLPFGGRLRRSGKRMLQLSGIVLLLAGAASLIGLTGCTAPLGQFASQNAQTYTVTVITTSGSQSQTANVTLIVE